VGRLELYVDGFSRAPITAAATNTSALFGIYRRCLGFSTSQDFNGDIALVARYIVPRRRAAPGSPSGPAQPPRAVQQGSARRPRGPIPLAPTPGYPRRPPLASEAAGWRGHQDCRRVRGDGRECGDMNILRLSGRCCWAGSAGPCSSA
jgi:hypothetical protein